MFPAKAIDARHASTDIVTDECVRRMYSNEILRHWDNSRWLLPETSRLSPSPRHIDFYTAACGKGIEFQSGGFALRLFLEHPTRREGFKSSFVKKTGEGILEVFNVSGSSVRMAGRWVTDDKTNQEVFIADETLSASTDNPFNYNHGYHLSRFLNKIWPDELLVKPRKKTAIADGPFVPPRNF